MDKRLIIASLIAIADKLDETQSKELINCSNALTKIAEDIVDNYNTLDGWIDEPIADSMPFDGPIDLGTDAGNDLGLELGSGTDLGMGGNLGIQDDTQFPVEETIEQSNEPDVKGVSNTASFRLKKKIRI